MMRDPYVITNKGSCYRKRRGSKYAFPYVLHRSRYMAESAMSTLVYRPRMQFHLVFDQTLQGLPRPVGSTLPYYAILLTNTYVQRHRFGSKTCWETFFNLFRLFATRMCPLRVDNTSEGKHTHMCGSSLTDFGVLAPKSTTCMSFEVEVTLIFLAQNTPGAGKIKPLPYSVLENTVRGIYTFSVT